MQFKPARLRPRRHDSPSRSPRPSPPARTRTRGPAQPRYELERLPERPATRDYPTSAKHKRYAKSSPQPQSSQRNAQRSRSPNRLENRVTSRNNGGSSRFSGARNARNACNGRGRDHNYPEKNGMSRTKIASEKDRGKDRGRASGTRDRTAGSAAHRSTFLPFFPRSASPERVRDTSPRTKALGRLADAWFVGVQFLTSLDVQKTYTINEMNETLETFVRKMKTSDNNPDVLATEINLRSLVKSLDIVDAHVRALAGPVEELKTLAKSQLFLSILRVLGHAIMFADLDCGGKPGRSSAQDGTSQMERLRLGSESLVDRCNLAMRSEREWIMKASERMCEAYMTQARYLNTKVQQAVKLAQEKKKRKRGGDGVQDDSNEGSLEEAVEDALVIHQESVDGLDDTMEVGDALMEACDDAAEVVENVAEDDEAEKVVEVAAEHVAKEDVEDPSDDDDEEDCVEVVPNDASSDDECLLNEPV
eukprot:GEMP01009375.1.p1 GENE.GEMP01009375.1~~GEMP01009375.1.p1  ORF type:complete len:477 (+),score=104.69 GEMP01009375.1:899-2329(+)